MFFGRLIWSNSEIKEEKKKRWWAGNFRPLEYGLSMSVMVEINT
jgi:hypothetical protein